MQRSHFDADQLPRERRWSAWRDSLDAFAIEARGDDERPGDGRISSCVAPSGLSFTLVESAAPQSLAAVEGRAGDVFWLAVNLDGASVLALDGGDAEMAPGDILYGKQGAPCALSLCSGFRLLLVNMPAQMVERRVLLPMPDRAIHVSGRAGMGRIFSGFLASVAAAFDDLDEALTGPIESALPQLLLTSLAGEAREVALAGAAAGRAKLLQRVWRTIEERLDEPDLSIADVAEAHGLSVRYLQKLFEDVDQNFSRYVRRRRLEQCRADLANPTHRHVSITTTAFRWGFNDSATFSRAFRDEFGLSPREYRRGHAGSPIRVD
ncbi:MAG: helix-turn-helix domain-containing protein [Caulobacteraceae bacterium]|nr:helix-turn-helix domain-containing protein [Caulobacteraceae bacterium]